MGGLYVLTDRFGAFAVRRSCTTSGVNVIVIYSTVRSFFKVHVAVHKQYVLAVYLVSLSVSCFTIESFHMLRRGIQREMTEPRTIGCNKVQKNLWKIYDSYYSVEKD